MAKQYTHVSCTKYFSMITKEQTKKCERYKKSVQNVIDTVSMMQNSIALLGSGFVLDGNVADSFLETEHSGENQFWILVKTRYKEECK